MKDIAATDAYWSDVLASRWRDEPLARSESLGLQAAWALVSMRIVGRLLGQLDASATFRDAELWFLGSVRTPSLLSDALVEIISHQAIRDLEAFEYDENLRDLLPYVLDAIGPGSRASVMKDPNTRAARRAKKTSGVFYTPADVAEYITREAIDQHPDAPELTVLDPACGSGVFIRAALQNLYAMGGGDRLSIAEQSLFGIDVNPLAIEAACFVLLHDCLLQTTAGRSPWSVWHRIRCNFCVMDALTIVRATSSTQADKARTEVAILREQLKRGSYVPPSCSTIDIEAPTALFGMGVELSSFFPSIADGAGVLVGNPPYAAVGERDDAAALEHRYQSLASGRVANADLYPVFIEMMWRLTREDCHSAGMVVPLSIAYSSRPQMTACRRAMTSANGRWRFAFFDREPHALFGEEVKTRNAIVFHDRSMGAAPSDVTTFETGPLRKWTSRQRPSLFGSIHFTPLDVDGISRGIPKLDGSDAAAVYRQVSQMTSHLRSVCLRVGTSLPEHAARDNSTPCVFVAGTAYNFLNVFRPHRHLPESSNPWSASALTMLEFADEQMAAVSFALLSSRFSYWLWHVKEDGFHVTRSFVASFPFPPQIEIGRLSELGIELWDELQDDQVVSVNGGRQTVAYRPHSYGRTRDEIDTVILDALGIDRSFVAYLRAFTRSLVTVDEHDESRRRFTDHFTDSDVPL